MSTGTESLYPSGDQKAAAHFVTAVRDHDQGALIRVLTFDEAHAQWACCGWWDRAGGSCDAVPIFRLATPHGHGDYCRDHIDYMLAALPPEWIGSWAHREPLAWEAQTDDIPF